MKLLSTVYFGPITYYARICDESRIMWEAKETFPKQSYRNRMYINGPNGPLMLSIPVSTSSDKLTESTKISYREDWASDHLKAFETSYGNSPFYEEIFPRVEGLYHENHKFLIDFNTEVHHLVSNLLRIQIEIVKSTEFKIPEKEDLRFSIHPKIEDSTLEKIPRYEQPFADKHPFNPKVSILDLLFQEGPWALNILKEIL